jgi:outer membrane protein OmpA-like peptidoglycan-associated protein
MQAEFFEPNALQPQLNGDRPHPENTMARLPLLAPLLLTLVAAAASAQQDVRQYRAGEAVDPRDVTSILGKPQAPAMKMRSIRLLDDGGAAAGGAAAGGAAAAAQAAYAATAGVDTRRAQASALSLPVQFAFDSAEILPAAHRQLDALAEGIRQLPGAKPVVIEGHTDALGPEQYNDLLSQRRADAVKRYLVVAHQIDPSRLRTVGMGEHAPLPGLDPLAAENRRVQFRGE